MTIQKIQFPSIDLPEIDASIFGASPSKPDNVAAFNAAADAARAAGKKLVCRVPGVYSLATETPLNLRFIEFDLSGVQLIVAHEDIGVIIGGNASNGSTNPPQRLFTVRRNGGPSEVPTVRAVGVKNQEIACHYSDYFQVWASTTAAVRNTDYSSAYSNFHLNHVLKLELQSDPANAGGPQTSDPGGAIQWINENTFYLKRCNGLIVDGTYKHNHNFFNMGTAEGPAEISILWGRDNYVLNNRFEAGPTEIYFGPNASTNKILKTWYSGEFPLSDPVITGSVVDDGNYNIVLDATKDYYDTVVVAEASIADPVVNNVVTADLLSSRAPQLQRIVTVGSNREVCYSDFIAAEVGLLFRFNFLGTNAGDTPRYRPFIEFYDKNLNPLPALGGGAGEGFWLDTPHLTSQASIPGTTSLNRLQPGTGATVSFASIRKRAIDDGVAFVRTGVLASGGQLANAVARRVMVAMSSPGNPDRNGIRPTIRQDGVSRVVTTVPTQGFAPLGHLLVDNDGISLYVCIFSLATQLNGAELAASTSIEVDNATGVLVGDIVGVNMDNRDTHWTTVSSVSGTTIGLTAGLAADSADNSRVVFNRWRTGAL